MAQNYYHGEVEPGINAYASVMAWNLKKLMERLIEDLDNSLLPPFQKFLLEIFDVLFYEKRTC